MSPSAVQSRPLPKFPFLLVQGLLVALGAFLLFFSPQPVSAGILLVVLLAVLVGTGVALVPFLWRGRSGSPRAVPRTPRPAPASPAPSQGERAWWAEIGEAIVGLRAAVEALREGERAEGERDKASAPRAEESLAALGRDLETLRDEVQVLRSHQASRSFVETGLLRQEEWLRRLESRQEEIYRLVRRTGSCGGPVAVGPASAPDPGISPASGREVPGPAGPGAGEPRGGGARSEPAPEPEEASLFTRLRVSAFLPSGSRVCLRGEGGGLSADEGLPLAMTGVGEWTWEGGLDDPLECELRLDDAVPSDLGRIRLYPGDDLTLTPSFGDADRRVES